MIQRWKFFLVGALALSLLLAPWSTVAVVNADLATSGGSSAAAVDPSSDNPPNPQPEGGNQGYSLEQAMSDNAQLSTIAFSGLAFITGNAGADTFFPPGKVADFFGFQYMRDVDTAGYGHNTVYLSQVANNVLSILNDEQRAKLIALAKEQAPLYIRFAYNRIPLTNAFRRNLEGDIPSGSTGLSADAVSAYTANLYKTDAEISYNRAIVVGEIIHSFSAEQIAYLEKMEFDDYSSWPDVAEDASLKASMTNDEFVAVMTYASELFSWYKGSLEADVYFCPERHATYFGGFFMKDYLAMNNPDYFISTSLTGDSGQGFLDVLNSEQRALIEGIIDEQRAALTEIASIRTQVATELRKGMSGGTVNQELVFSLIERYGELDGQISARCALRFAQVNQTLTNSQRSALIALRNLDVVPEGAYLFSTPVPMPEIPNTDYLLGVGAMPDDAGQTIAPASFVSQTQQPSQPENSTGPNQPGDQKARNIRVFVNGTDLRFDTPPVIVNGRVLAPVRAIAEALGADVQWNQDTLTVTISQKNTNISLVVGDVVAKVNRQDVTLDAPPQVTGGRVLVPVRFIAEAFSLTVAWDNQTRTVTVGSGGAPTLVASSTASGFVLTSPEVAEGGLLPTDYTCDGSSATLPLEWSGEPVGTVSFAVIMHTTASPTDTHVYWVLYNIPADIHSLAKNTTGVGTMGINSKDGQQAYTPPCSQGPGPKNYTYTVYALSAQPQFTVSAAEVTRDILMAAMQGITLASAELHVVYSR